MTWSYPPGLEHVALDRFFEQEVRVVRVAQLAHHDELPDVARRRVDQLEVRLGGFVGHDEADLVGGFRTVILPVLGREQGGLVARDSAVGGDQLVVAVDVGGVDHRSAGRQDQDRRGDQGRKPNASFHAHPR